MLNLQQPKLKNYLMENSNVCKKTAEFARITTDTMYIDVCKKCVLEYGTALAWYHIILHCIILHPNDKTLTLMQYSVFTLPVGPPLASGGDGDEAYFAASGRPACTRPSCLFFVLEARCAFCTYGSR